jgi:hypothetical protein
VLARREIRGRVDVAQECIYRYLSSLVARRFEQETNRKKGRKENPLLPCFCLSFLPVTIGQLPFVRKQDGQRIFCLALRCSSTKIDLRPQPLSQLSYVDLLTLVSKLLAACSSTLRPPP